MRYVLLVISHILRLGGTLAAAVGAVLFAMWVLDQSSPGASSDLLAAGAAVMVAGAVALWGGGAVARLVEQRLTSAATPRIAEELG